jgi:hypothetical protein
VVQYQVVAENDPSPPLIQSYKVQDTINIQYILQLGMMSLIPYVAEMALEVGILNVSTLHHRPE